MTGANTRLDFVSDASAAGLLEGVFRDLLSRQVPLGVRDYIDALRALQAGFGGNGREDLRLLCYRLWARNDVERRAIDVTFGLIASPTDHDPEVAEFEDLFADRPADRGQPPATAATTNAAAASARGPARPAVEGSEPRAGVSFAPSTDAAGIPLPPATFASHTPETYVLNAQVLFSERELAVTWRRLRRVARRGAGRELDIAATIGEQCRSGVLVHGVLRSPRSNVAGLAVLADVSPSMAPWRPFLRTLSESLALSKLRAHGMFYFSNFPREWIFCTPQLDQRIHLDEFARSHGGLPLLVIGDAGAARGRYNPRRVRQTASFIERVARDFHPIVWINPMPRHRWAGSSAGALGDQSLLSALPLDKESLIRAMDVLRGARRS
jgi:uncharacterized protein with von Willebrand factor type A (vWA) domain